MPPFLRRAPVRLVLGLALLLGVAIALQLGLGRLPFAKTPAGTVVVALLLAAAAFATYVGFVRAFETRRPEELAPRRAAPELAAGAAGGTTLFLTTIGILALLGDFAITGRNAASVVPPLLAGAVASGVFEELLVRGVLFRILEEGLGTWIALAISALLFGALHLPNPNATLVSALAIALEAGVLLAAAFVATRRLWVPIGLHIAWNFTQAFLGVAVSGRAMTGYFRSTLRGPALVSGGAFGAEASVVAVLVCLVAAAGFLGYAAKRGRILAPAWRRQAAAVPGAVAAS